MRSLLRCRFLQPPQPIPVCALKSRFVMGRRRFIQSLSVAFSRVSLSRVGHVGLNACGNLLGIHVAAARTFSSHSKSSATDAVNAEPATLRSDEASPWWNPATFEKLLGTSFVVAGQRLLLDEVERYHKDPRLNSFSLRFQGSALWRLEVGPLYRFRHAQHPDVDFAVVPGAPDGLRISYRVTICRFASKRSAHLSRREWLRFSLCLGKTKEASA